MEYLISDHGKAELLRRGISGDLLEDVLRQPEQVIEVRAGRKVLQSRVTQDGKQYLLRVVVDSEGSRATVVTAYRTKKIGKYWRIQ